MTRFTRKDLTETLDTINAKSKNGRHLQAQGRNGYTGLDEYNEKGCIRTVACGSPRECADADAWWLVEQFENN